MWQRLIFGRTTVQRPLAPGPFAGQHVIRNLQLAVAPGVSLEAWVAEPTAVGPRKVLLYFGGRNENVVWAPKMCSHLGHWAVYAFNYRGMGESGGRPEESQVKNDAMLILRYVLQREAGATHFAIMGRSLGSAIALHVCAHADQADPMSKSICHLVLLSPLDSLFRLLRMSRLLSPLSRLVKHRFDNEPLARATQVPTSVLLAEHDSRVPHVNSHRLAKQLTHMVGIEVIQATTHKTLPRHPQTQRRIAQILNASSASPSQEAFYPDTKPVQATAPW